MIHDNASQCNEPHSLPEQSWVHQWTNPIDRLVLCDCRFRKWWFVNLSMIWGIFSKCVRVAASTSSNKSKRDRDRGKNKQNHKISNDSFHFRRSILCNEFLFHSCLVSSMCFRCCFMCAPKFRFKAMINVSISQRQTYTYSQRSLRDFRMWTLLVDFFFSSSTSLWQF